jgi:hypothetical protein
MVEVKPVVDSRDQQADVASLGLPQGDFCDKLGCKHLPNTIVQRLFGNGAEELVAGDLPGMEVNAS